MAEPTRGPWHWDGKWQVVIPHADGPTALSVAPEDARAISAVPEFIEAARAALTYHEAIHRHAAKGQQWVDDGELDMLYEHWLNASRDALRKALDEGI